MEAPLHQLPVPPPPQDAFLQQAVAAHALMMAISGNNKAPPSPVAAGPGKEQCPRCASRDTKFCYYNNYNTAQPRHFCRACRRYWTLGGSLRNVPVGGSTRKRPRPARRGPTRAAMAAAVAAMATTGGGTPFAASPASLQGAGGGNLLVNSLLLGLGAAPLLEGRLGFDLGLGEPGGGGGGATAGDMTYQQQLPLGVGAPLPWPAATTILEGDNRAETTTWKAASSVFPFPPVGALWQELAAAAPAVEAAPHLLL